MKPIAILRTVAALGLLAWLLNRIGHTDVLERLRHASPLLMLAAVAVIVLDGLLRAWNWRQLLQAMRLAPHVPYGRLLGNFWSSAFLGQVLPSTAGTDALRALGAARTVGGPLSAHVAAVVMVNAVSLFAGCAIGLACLPFLGLAIGEAHGMRPAVALVFAAAVLGASGAYLTVKYQRGLVLRCLGVLKGRRGLKLRRGLRRFVDKILVFERYDARPLPVFGIACLTLLTRSGAFALAGAAVGIHLPVLAWLTLAPSVMLSGLVPYNVAGYGGDQAASVYFLGGFGASAADALALALLMPLVPMAFNLLGAIPTVLGGGLRGAAPERAAP